MTGADATETSRGDHWVVFVHLTALPEWLSLTRAERHHRVAEQVEPVLAANAAVRVRWIDVEAFTADCSDVLVAETDDLSAWNRLVEALRDTALFAEPLFRLDRVIVGLEDGYQRYEAQLT